MEATSIIWENIDGDIFVKREWFNGSKMNAIYSGGIFIGMTTNKNEAIRLAEAHDLAQYELPVKHHDMAGE